MRYASIWKDCRSQSPMLFYVYSTYTTVVTQLLKEKYKEPEYANVIQFAMMTLPVLKALHSFAHVNSAPRLAGQFLNGCLNGGHRCLQRKLWLSVSLPVSDYCWFLGFLWQERKVHPNSLKTTFSPTTMPVECVHWRKIKSQFDWQKAWKGHITYDTVRMEACRYDRIQSIL